MTLLERIRRPSRWWLLLMLALGVPSSGCFLRDRRYVAECLETSSQVIGESGSALMVQVEFHNVCGRRLQVSTSGVSVEARAAGRGQVRLPTRPMRAGSFTVRSSRRVRRQFLVDGSGTTAETRVCVRVSFRGQNRCELLNGWRPLRAPPSEPASARGVQVVATADPPTARRLAQQLAAVARTAPPATPHTELVAQPTAGVQPGESSDQPCVGVEMARLSTQQDHVVLAMTVKNRCERPTFLDLHLMRFTVLDDGPARRLRAARSPDPRVLAPGQELIQTLRLPRSAAEQLVCTDLSASTTPPVPSPICIEIEAASARASAQSPVLW